MVGRVAGGPRDRVSPPLAGSFTPSGSNLETTIWNRRRAHIVTRSVVDGHITIDVWSDVACPWCYIGKRNLETA